MVGRTARVVASRVVAEIDFAGRLAQCEQALLLLLNAGRPAAAPQTASKEVQEVPAEPAIVNNNTETMALAEAPAAAATPEPAAIDNNNGITMETAAALDEAVRAALPPRQESVEERLMSSVSPAALLLDVDPRKTPSVITPEAPLSNAA